MSTYSVLDGTGALKNIYGLGTGTTGDPYRLVSNYYTQALNENGKYFIYNDRHSTANNATILYLLKTPANPLDVTLLSLGFAATACPLSYDFYEDAVVSANGTLDTLYNNNRQLLTANNTLIYATPTVTSNGTALFGGVVTGDKTIGGVINLEFNTILKASVNYLLSVTNSSGVTSNIAFFIKFTET